MCSKEGKRPIYLSSQPAFESMISDLRIELTDAMEKAHEELKKSMEERIRLLEESLLEEIHQIHDDFNRERCQAEHTEKDWLHSYTKLQTVVVVFAGFVLFKTCIETSFGALLFFFILMEGALLSTERDLQKLKDAVNKVKSQMWDDNSRQNSGWSSTDHLKATAMPL